MSNIDFVDMRARTGIPSGDLFTVMESWDDGDRWGWGRNPPDVCVLEGWGGVLVRV